MRRDTLNEQDRTTLRLIAEGRSNAEIARLFCRSPNTVSNRITRLYGVLGISAAAHQQRSGSRIRLVMMAVHLGLVSVEAAVRQTTSAAPSTQRSASPARAGR